MLELERDPLVRNKLEKKLESLKNEVQEDEKHTEGCIDDFVQSLFVSVRNETLQLAMQNTGPQIEELRASRYKGVAEKVMPNLEKILSESTRVYFGEERINIEVETYARVNQENVVNLTRGVKCFPADATVIEKSRGEIKMPQVKVGYQLLTLSSNGLLSYQDVFMLGK